MLKGLRIATEETPPWHPVVATAPPPCLDEFLALVRCLRDSGEATCMPAYLALVRCVKKDAPAR